MVVYIVRDFDNKAKYLIRTSSLVDALKVLDAARVEGKSVDLCQKTKGGPLSNQLQGVSTDAIAAARARM